MNYQIRVSVPIIYSVSTESAQTGRLLRTQDIRHIPAGVRDDHFRRVHGPGEAADLRHLFSEAGETPGAVPVQRDAPQTHRVFQVHEAKGDEVGPGKQTGGRYHNNLTWYPSNRTKVKTVTKTRDNKVGENSQFKILYKYFMNYLSIFVF